MQPRRLLVPLGFVCVMLVVLTTVVLVAGGQRGGTQAAGPAEPSARDVVRAWDERRAAVWAEGDVAALRTLYVADAAAGREDARMLRAYVSRGLVVEGMRTQVLAFEVLHESEDALDVQLTDRVVGAVAVSEAGERTLPVGAPQERILRLRREDGEWRVAAVETVEG